MNKRTIQDVDARLEILHKRLTRTVNEINDLRARRRKMVAGKLKVPPPAGAKIMIKSPEFADDIPDDIRPVAPGSSGPC